jgi:flagella basal body P-ring formation protein FlgA
MRFRLATIASIVVLVLAIAVVGREALRPADDPQIPFPIREVVLAVQAIEAGTRIEPEMIAIRAVPLDDTNSMAYTELSQVLGEVAAIDILELQLMTPNLLVDE